MANVHTFHSSNTLQLLTFPDEQASANTAWVAPFADGGGSDRAVFILLAGSITEEIDMALYQATDASGTGAKAITDAAITQITSATDQVIVSIEIGPGALDDVNSFKYVRAQVIVDGAASEDWAVLYIKHRLRYPGVGTQHASYAEQVVKLG